MDNGFLYHVFRNLGQGPTTHGLKSLDRVCDAMLPYPTVVLSAKDEFKIFQHYMYFSSDNAAAGLSSDHLTALLFFFVLFCFLLSHLLVAGCDIGVRFSVRLSVNIYVEVRHLCQS